MHFVFMHVFVLLAGLLAASDLSVMLSKVENSSPQDASMRMCCAARRGIIDVKSDVSGTGFRMPVGSLATASLLTFACV
jgi:hypothetical protein